MEEMRKPVGKIPPPSKHPTDCRKCGGSGYMPGPPIEYRTSSYDTVEPCTYEDWRTYDDPDVDEYGLDKTNEMTFDEYYTRLLARADRNMPGAEQELAGGPVASQPR